MYTVTKGSSSFNKDILRLAVPIVLQNIVTTAVNSADVIMLGFVGQNALSAGSLANQVMFILQRYFFRCYHACRTVLGKKRYKDN